MLRWTGVILAFWLAAVPAFSAEKLPRPKAVRSDIQLAVQVAASGLGGLVAGVEGREEQLRLLRGYVAKARFFPDGEGYFFVYDQDGTCVAHGAQPELVGRSLMDLKDASGFSVVRALVEVAGKGGGYVEYAWPKPGNDGSYDKIGYVEAIPGTGYIIGSGLYYVDLH
ncbi:cache domain-containing protein [Pseudodesulfovibrio indicus]|uniref:cache domain-containing protein n=1 Tax=Pseudodesulfovibrio indicus TaxID=1716143 RepID=UPI00292CEACC|nr:cache domain-containing protein [Pseudodesulfovibrio indicus]